MSVAPPVYDPWKAFHEAITAHYTRINQARTRAGRPARAIPAKENLSKVSIFDPIIKRASSDGDEDDTILSPLDKIKAEMATSKNKIAGAKSITGDKGWWDKAKDFPLGILGGGVDLLNRTGAFSLAYLDEAFDQQAGKGRPGNPLVNMIQRGAGAFVGKDEDRVSGSQLLEEHTPIGGMSGGWQKSALTHGGGLITEIATDPLSYVSLGAGTILARSAKAALKGERVATGVQRAVDVASKELKLGERIARGSRKIDPSEIDTAVAKLAAEEAKLGSTSAARKQAEREIAGKAKKAKGQVPAGVYRDEEIVERALELLKPKYNQVRRVLQHNTQRKVQVKVLGQDILRGRVGEAVGKALYYPVKAGGKGLGKVPGVALLKEGFSMSHHFPGLTNRIRRMVEGRGILQHEVFSKTVDDLVRGLTHDELRTISNSLEVGSRTVGMSGNGKDLGEIYDFFDDYRKKTFKDLVDAGIYEQSEDAGDFFLPQFFKGGRQHEILAYKPGRKAALRAKKGKLSDYLLANAKEKGLNPYDRVDDIFKMYDADVTRRLARVHNRNQVIGTYGVVTTAADQMAKDGYVNVTKHLSKVEAAKLKTGEQVFLHRNLNRSLDSMEKFFKMGNNDELNKFLRLTNRATNMWKRTATVYNPGNWVNNTIGDMYLNWIDGVANPLRYEQALRIITNPGSGFIKIGKYRISNQEIRRLYDEFSKGAGFFQADVYTPTRRFTSKVSRAYQAREDFSRMAHFIHALEDEFGRIAKQPGLNPTGKAFKKHIEAAAEAAGERVSRWNIDYSSFSPLERTIKKFVPFYSWQRKSIPLLLEALALKPGRVGMVHKAQTSLDRLMGGGERGEYDVAYPFWLRDAGFMRLSGGPEPTAIKNPLPTSMLGKTFGGDWGDVLRGQMAALHPALRVIPEMAYGKQTYTDSDIPESLGEYLLNQLPATGTISAIAARDIRKGMDSETLSGGQRIGQLLGSKPYHVDEDMQASELRRQQDSLQAQVAQINDKIAPWVVRKNSDGSYQAYNEVTKQKGSKFDNAKSAMEQAIQKSGVLG